MCSPDHDRHPSSNIHSLVLRMRTVVLVLPCLTPPFTLHYNSHTPAAARLVRTNSRLSPLLQQPGQLGLGERRGKKYTLNRTGLAWLCSAKMSAVTTDRLVTTCPSSGFCLQEHSAASCPPDYDSRLSDSGRGSGFQNRLDNTTD